MLSAYVLLRINNDKRWNSTNTIKIGNGLVGIQESWKGYSKSFNRRFEIVG